MGSSAAMQYAKKQAKTPHSVPFYRKNSSKKQLSKKEDIHFLERVCFAL